MEDQNKNSKPLGENKTVTLADGKVVELTADMKTVQLSKEEMQKLRDGMLAQMAGAPNAPKVFSIPPPVDVSAPPQSEPEKVEAAPPKEPVVSMPVILDANGNDIRLREENVQEILTAIPHWMIRWGNTLFCSLILMLLLMSWFVKYPEVVSAPVTIVNKYPSQVIEGVNAIDIGAVLVEQGASVEKGQVLAVKKNAANHKDVLQLKAAADAISLNSKSFDFPFYQLPELSLGELQAQFAQFENSYLSYKRNQNKIERIKSQMYASNFPVNSTKNDLRLFQEVIKDFQSLKQDLNNWSEQYLIRAKLDGVVEQLNLSRDAEYTAQHPFMVIDPTTPAEFIAKLEVPTFNSGKIQKDQSVLLKLNNYPEMEFGMLEGAITNRQVSALDNEQGFLVEAALPGQLRTSYNIEIDYNGILKGQADIIIKKERLLQKFFSSMN